MDKSFVIEAKKKWFWSMIALSVLVNISFSIACSDILFLDRTGSTKNIQIRRKIKWSRRFCFYSSNEIHGTIISKSSAKILNSKPVYHISLIVVPLLEYCHDEGAISKYLVNIFLTASLSNSALRQTDLISCTFSTFSHVR